MNKNILNSQLVNPEHLTEVQKKQMYQVLIKHFDGQTWDVFIEDLNKKNWVFILVDPNSKDIYGFSTLLLLKEVINNKPAYALFSGDTIIDKKYWGKHDMFKKWLLFALYLSYKLDDKLYWFLISKGYRTYRLLPKFYREFYPCFQKYTPQDIQKHLNLFASSIFPEEYNKNTGIIHFEIDKQRLKNNVGNITKEAMADPNVAFFAQKNPNHMQGDELACLAEINLTNIKLPINLPRFLLKLYIYSYGLRRFKKII